MKTILTKLAAGLLVLFMAFALVPAARADGTVVLTSSPVVGSDIGGHRYESELKSFIEKGYLRGFEDGTVRPDQRVTRAEFAAFINRVAGFEGSSNIIWHYSDVKTTDWFYRHIAAALGAGYLVGASGTAMEPDGPITARQADIVLSRLTGSGRTVTSDAALTRGEVIKLLSDALPALEGKALAGDTVYGTATLSYAEFYSGDVTSVDSFDAVSSATTGKSGTFKNSHTDFVSAEQNPNGYRVLGVKNVNVAVKAADLAAYKALNPTFVPSGTRAPAQYKSVTIENGRASYSATVFSVKDTVSNARAALKTGSVWGDYEIDVYDNEGADAAKYLRRDRQDNWAVNSYIQGIILETADGFKVGMEHLQSIWVQPYEVSFNVTQQSLANAHIAKGGRWDNIAELSKLVGKTVKKITYIMPDGVYVYEFEGIYIKPAFESAVWGDFKDNCSRFELRQIPAELESASLTVNYTVGSGRQRKVTVLYSGEIKASVELDAGALAAAGEGGVFSAIISSDNYADITVLFPMTEAEKDRLTALIARAEEVLLTHDDAGVREHMQEARELIADPNASSAAARELISELEGHLSVYSGEGSGGRH